MLEELGDDEINGKNSGAIDKTHEEIREIMNKVTVNALKITKQSGNTAYDYEWSFHPCFTECLVIRPTYSISTIIYAYLMI